MFYRWQRLEIGSDRQGIGVAEMLERIKRPGDYLFPSRRFSGRPLTPRQYARLVSRWLAEIGLDPRFYGTHSLRRTKATLIYRRTGNLRAVRR